MIHLLRMFGIGAVAGSLFSLLVFGFRPFTAGWGLAWVIVLTVQFLAERLAKDADSPD